MSDLLQRVDANIQNRLSLKRGQAVLVAVSGGADSMVLLHALHELSARHGWKLTVAHFNHRLRGRSSDADEKQVRRTAARLKLPLVTGGAAVKEFARKSKLSVEMAARKLRHEFLARAARERNIRIVALAHHADDQVELFFLRVLRGAGGEGLAGMKWRSPSPADEKIRLVRPLLDVTKGDLRRFARENKIPFREDATNSSTDLLRNRIRHELLPLLRKKYQPGLNRTVLRLMEIVGAEAELVSEAARRWLDKTGRADLPVGQDAPQRVPPNPNFENLPLALQRKVLHRQLIQLDLAADFELVEQLRETPAQPVSVAAGLSVVLDPAGRLKLLTQSLEKFNIRAKALRLAGRAGDAEFDGVRLNWQRDARLEFIRPPGQKGCENFDADRVGDKITLRHWRPGDRFQPIGLKSAVKLQDLFTNRKIPRAQRRELVVGVAESGEIFWVEGLRIGERFKLDPRTKRRLGWRWQRLAGP